MDDGSDLLWRPVARGWIKAESLFDGTFDLEHIAQINDAISVDDENQTRWDEANK